MISPIRTPRGEKRGVTARISRRFCSDLRVYHPAGFGHPSGYQRRARSAPQEAHFGLPSLCGACPRPTRRVARPAAAGRLPGGGGSSRSSCLLRPPSTAPRRGRAGERAGVPLDRGPMVSRRGPGQGETRCARPMRRTTAAARASTSPHPTVDRPRLHHLTHAGEPTRPCLSRSGGFPGGPSPQTTADRLRAFLHKRLWRASPSGGKGGDLPGDHACGVGSRSNVDRQLRRRILHALGRRCSVARNGLRRLFANHQFHRSCADAGHGDLVRPALHERRAGVHAIRNPLQAGFHELRVIRGILSSTALARPPWASSVSPEGDPALAGFPVSDADGAPGGFAPPLLQPAARKDARARATAAVSRLRSTVTSSSPSSSIRPRRWAASRFRS